MGASGRQAYVRRVDEPSKTGPTKWLNRYTNTGHGYGKDYWTTSSAAGKNYTTNKATWTFTTGAPGVYRVKAFIPKRHAVAKVTYRIYDNGKHVQSVTIDQRNSYGFVNLTTRNFTSTKIKVVQADNWGPGPYGSMIGWDAIEVVPIR